MKKTKRVAELIYKTDYVMKLTVQVKCNPKQKKNHILLDEYFNKT